MMKVVDLSRTISNREEIYPGNPEIRIMRFRDHSEGCNISKIDFGSHSSTHVDVPLHHFIDGMDTATMPLIVFMGNAVVLRVKLEENNIISRDALKSEEIKEGDIVLISTGWEDKIGTRDYFYDYPYMSAEGAHFLIEKKVKCVGGDFPGFDSPKDENQPAHHLLLGKGIGLVEGLINLKGLSGQRFFFCASPLKIEGSDGSPVRAFAILDFG
jgi:kynurenine formamidase